MYLVQSLTANPKQDQTLILPDGTTLVLSLAYVPLQQGWFVTSLTWGSFTLEGLRLTNSPNLLHQWRNQISFGLFCTTAGNREPTQLEDFSSGAARLLILTADEVAQYTEYLSGG